VEVLAAPVRTAQAEVISGERFREVLTILQTSYDTVIVDASVSSLDAMLASLEVADLALLVTTLEVVTIKDVNQVIGMLVELRFPMQNLLLVGNRHDGRVSLDPEQVSKTIGMRFTVLLPQDPRVILAGNRGIPVVLAEPRIAFSQRIRDLAKALETELGRKHHVHE
jgi:pilus assembly protein CpaE